MGMSTTTIITTTPAITGTAMAMAICISARVPPGSRWRGCLRRG